MLLQNNDTKGTYTWIAALNTIVKLQFGSLNKYNFLPALF